MKRVVIESPYSGEVERNRAYLKRCRLDSLSRGEAPFASHHAYTDILDDELAEERELGMRAGFAWMRAAELVAVYVDYGISPGMYAGMERAYELGIPSERRRIGENPM